MQSQSISVIAIALAALAIVGAASLQNRAAPPQPTSPATEPAVTIGTYTDADGATWYQRCESGFCRLSPDAESLVTPVVNQATGAGGLPTVDLSAINEVIEAASLETAQ